MSSWSPEVSTGAFAVSAIGSMMDLAAAYGDHREGVRMGLWGSAQAVAFAIGGVVDGVTEDHRFTASLSGPIRPLLAFLATQPVVGMLIEEPDLEEAFLDLYQEES